MREIVTIDIGGTNARFAIARIDEGAVPALNDAVTFPTTAHVSFETAWAAFAAKAGRPLPDAVAIAIAGVVEGDAISFTNNPWIIRPYELRKTIGVTRHVLINDFEAIGHAVARSGPDMFRHLCGPDMPLPASGTISILGPGTGLGVCHIWRDAAGYHVQPTEGGHIDFAPLDMVEDALLSHLRKRHRRVSIERVVSGPGIVDIYQVLASIEGRAVHQLDDLAIWQSGDAGQDSLAVAAIDRFCACLGSVAGDIALAQGGSGVVIAGGLGQRLGARLLKSEFAVRFRAKGRFESLMDAIPVKLITHPQPGLFGAAVAFAREYP